jgi:translation initiation factor 2 beta subunit (eIF-2beta)/eIF-5
MSAPEYLICLECETPCYIFDWVDGRIVEAQCTACGNDDPAAFMTEEELEEFSEPAGGAEPE